MEKSESWVDITSLLRAAASEIRPGRFVAGPKFSFEASMRAIDIMDPKIDSGLGVMDIEPIFVRVKNGIVVFHPGDV